METTDLSGRKGLVVGVANAESLAWSAPQHFRAASADLALTYYSDKAKTHVEPPAREVQALLLPCNVLRTGEGEGVLQRCDCSSAHVCRNLHDGHPGGCSTQAAVAAQSTRTSRQ